jgi:hypothetical protein
MVFYVCHGRVDVDISGVQFSAGKGSVFQVPRGESRCCRLGSVSILTCRKGTTTAFRTHMTGKRGCSLHRDAFQPRAKYPLRRPRPRIQGPKVRSSLKRHLLRQRGEAGPRASKRPAGSFAFVLFLAPFPLFSLSFGVLMLVGPKSAI